MLPCVWPIRRLTPLNPHMLCGAGIFIKNIIAYIEKSKTGLHKRFTLFTKVRGKGTLID